MKIKVIGKKQMKGTSKRTGNDYDFIVVYYIGREDDRVQGRHGCELNLDPQLIPYNDIAIDAEYNAEFGPRGRVTAFVPCK